MGIYKDLQGKRVMITGAASGIGLAAAKRFAAAGMRLCLADRDAEKLREAGNAVAEHAKGGLPDIRTVPTDVASPESVGLLKETAYKAFGEVALLMNNAAIGDGAGPWQDPAQWHRLMDINFYGVLNGLQAFVPDMIVQGTPCAIVNTGSKQGITTPPGDPAYNVAKAGVKVFTEALAHELRTTEGATVSAHLLIPGFVFTELTAQGRTEIPAAAWTPEETVAFMLNRLEQGDFYILCPDNDVPRALDERRIAWAAGDIIENRPALSRWHPDFAEAFTAFARGKD